MRYDSPMLTGKTKLRDGWQEEGGSQFCSKKTCLDFLKQVIEATVAKHIFVTYSSDGLLTPEDFYVTFDKVTMEIKLQRRYKSDKSEKRDYSKKPLFEYLFHIEK